MILKDCHLLKLPRELRNEIYFILFNSTRLSFGPRLIEEVGGQESMVVKPAANPLAILRACHQINAETRDAWLGRVTFRFENLKVLMKKLHTLPDSIISQMRYLHICDHCMQYRDLNVDAPGRHRPSYCVSTYLRLFPSLQLDRLTVSQRHCCYIELVWHMIKKWHIRTTWTGTSTRRSNYGKTFSCTEMDMVRTLQFRFL